jgi:hypothetical protein
VSCRFAYALVIAGTIPPDTTSRISPESHFPAARSNPSRYPRPAMAHGSTPLVFLICSNSEMNDRPASWRMPPPEADGETCVPRAAASCVRRSGSRCPLPDEYWEALLGDPRAAGRPRLPIQQRRLLEIPARSAPCRMRPVLPLRRNPAARRGQIVRATCGLERRRSAFGCWPDFSQ